jgi:hypothetical protein
MSQHKHHLWIIIVLLLLLAPGWVVKAQGEDALKLRLQRNFGYGSSRAIQGIFTLKASGPETLQQVEFFIDSQSIADDKEAPFEVQFSTDSFPLGMHTMHATGYTSSGIVLESNSIQMEFVSANEGWQAGFKFAGPILLLILLIIASSFLFTFLSSSKKLNPAPGTQRKYGFSGGSICPKCKRPTPLHLLGLNLLGGKFDRCENCGKWSVMHPRSMADLRQAETDELARARLEESGAFTPAPSADEKLTQELNDSRYQDL